MTPDSPIRNKLQELRGLFKRSSLPQLAKVPIIFLTIKRLESNWRIIDIIIIFNRVPLENGYALKTYDAKAWNLLLNQKLYNRYPNHQERLLRWKYFPSWERETRFLHCRSFHSLNKMKGITYGFQILQTGSGRETFANERSRELKEKNLGIPFHWL